MLRFTRINKVTLMYKTTKFFSYNFEYGTFKLKKNIWKFTSPMRI